MSIAKLNKNRESGKPEWTPLELIYSDDSSL